MITALVTGATGMIGYDLVGRLLREGLAVRVLVRPTSRIDLLRSYPVAIVSGDSDDHHVVEQAVRGVSYVFHAAGYVRAGSAFSASDASTEDAYEDTNVALTERLLQASSNEALIRFVYLSSSAVYGTTAVSPIREDAPLEPDTPYGRSKVAAETRVATHHARGLPTTIVRPGITYGLHDRHFLPSIKALRRTPILPLIDGGTSLQDLTYVADVSDLCWYAAAAEAGNGSAYNAGSGHPLAIRDIVRIYTAATESHLRIVPISKATFARLSVIARPLLGLIAPTLIDVASPLGAAYLSQDVVYAMDKAADQLGFRPQYDFERGLAAYQEASGIF